MPFALLHAQTKVTSCEVHGLDSLYVSCAIVETFELFADGVARAVRQQERETCRSTPTIRPLAVCLHRCAVLPHCILQWLSLTHL